MIQVTHATPGFLSLAPDAQMAALQSLKQSSALKSDDWLYSVPAEDIPGGLPDGSLYVFFAQNEVGGFTAMLGSEY